MVSIKKYERGPVISICDADIMGKTFEEGNRILDLSSDYYIGDLKSESELNNLIKGSCNLNFIGENSVNFGIKNELIEEQNILRVQKIPHAQCIFFR